MFRSIPVHSCHYDGQDGHWERSNRPEEEPKTLCPSRIIVSAQSWSSFYLMVKWKLNQNFLWITTGLVTLNVILMHSNENISKSFSIRFKNLFVATCESILIKQFESYDSFNLYQNEVFIGSMVDFISHPLKIQCLWW